mgnify:CR=1 FL=1
MYSKNGFLLGVLSSVILSSCSVREARDLCPCTVSICLENLGKEALSQMQVDMVICRYGDSTVCYPAGRVPPSESIGVMQPYFELCSVATGRLWIVTGAMDSLLIPYGMQCPPVYIYSKILDTDREQVQDTVRLHKAFAVMDISAPAFLEPQYEMSLRGDICGYDLSGRTLHGDFNCTLKLDKDGLARAAVPRQTDDKLTLEVRKGPDLVRSYPLGRYIDLSGYDWGEEELQDMRVDIGLESTGITYSSGLWETTRHFSVLL